MKESIGRVLKGDEDLIERQFNELNEIPVDLDLSDYEEKSDYVYPYQLTIAHSVDTYAQGTFNCKQKRKISFDPTDRWGWWIKRTDIPNSAPVMVSHEHARTTADGGVKNIVLDGEKIIHARLVEHLIALKAGLDIDNLILNVGSDDPPLFESGSEELVKILNTAGRKKTSWPCKYVTVKETVSAVWPDGSFLIIAPADKDNPQLNLDCAVNYNNIMGKQRIKYTVSLENFTKGSQARTDASLKHAILCKTIGKILPATRNLGYNNKNVLVAGSNKYYTTPKLFHNGKSLESVWHRATLDLLAAVALISEGRFMGTLTSYKAGHTQDVQFVNMLYKNDMFEKLCV